MLRELTLENFLSFGPEPTKLEMRPLNVLIGPNGSGKSNLIEALSILRSAPRDLGQTIREGGGILDLLHERNPSAAAAIECVFGRDAIRDHVSVRHRLQLSAQGNSHVVSDERIEIADGPEPEAFFRYDNGGATLSRSDATGGSARLVVSRTLRPQDIDRSKSILAQRRDPDNYPEVTKVGALLAEIAIYRDWHFGRRTAARLPQRADLPTDFPVEDWTNLGLVLNQLDFTPAGTAVKEQLRHLFDGIRDVKVKVDGGSVQVFLQEGNSLFPATRLSDGTLRYLCLLTILCHPKPPPLVVVEEPELGLHPDVVVGLADLLREASTRTQLVVTTHSDLLVSALSETPESVVVCEKQDGVTCMRRLDATEIAPWLDRYRLGQLWLKGHIGGARW